MADPQQTVQSGPDKGMSLVGGFNELADKIRAKFPGDYDDMSDSELTQKVIAKYPEYKDLALPYDAQIQRGGKWTPVRLSSLSADEKNQAQGYAPPDPEFWRHTYQGAKEGAMAATAPLALGASAPQLVGGIVGGAVGTAGGQVLAKKAGIGEFGQEVAGDVGGLAGGAVAATGTNWAAQKATQVYKALPPEVQDALIGLLTPRGKEGLRLAAALGIGKQAEPVFPRAPLGPETPPAELTQAASLYRGVRPVEDPSAGLGQIGVRPPGAAGSMVDSVTAPPSRQVSPAVVEQQLNDALGGKPLQRDVPLRQQGSANGNTAAKLPEGFAPVESSALKGFKYNPASHEFETITPAGQHYIYGDVSPEEAQAFMDADSKGRAWQDIQRNTLVAKVVNGKRIAIKPRTDFGLADLLKKGDTE